MPCWRTPVASSRRGTPASTPRPTSSACSTRTCWPSPLAPGPPTCSPSCDAGSSSVGQRGSRPCGHWRPPHAPFATPVSTRPPATTSCWPASPAMPCSAGAEPTVARSTPPMSTPGWPEEHLPGAHPPASGSPRGCWPLHVTSVSSAAWSTSASRPRRSASVASPTWRCGSERRGVRPGP